ncbi:hypothetical protein QBC44DRAFT_291415 [Cladorrhinum sp. PSN332]|nr:hypothetical protein QBC44DRAFT_291415 [Cladorrhinum sp. PSN332]
MDAATSQSERKKRSPPEDEASNSEGSAASRKRARVDVKAADTNKGDERDEGEISDSKDEGSEVAVASNNGWNGGVSSGLRTSFPSLKRGANSKPLRQLTPHESAKSEAEPESNSKTEVELQSKEEGEVESQPESKDEGEAEGEFEKLVMPEGYANYSKTRRARSWDSRFEGWCLKLMSLNKDHDRMQDATFLKAAWTGWLKQRKHINPLSLTAGLQACEKFELDAEKLKDMLSRALSSEPNSPADSTSTAEPASNDLGNNNNNNNKITEQPSTVIDMDQLMVPPTPLSDYLAKVKAGDDKAWEEMFLNWCWALKDMNRNRVDVTSIKSRNKLADFYSNWVKKLEGLSKKNAATARRVAFDYVQRKGQGLVTLFETEQPAPSSLVDFHPQLLQGLRIADSDNAVAMAADTPMEDAQEEQLIPVKLTEGELAYRDRYYPGLAPDAVFCVYCASTEHDSADCAEMTCKFCSNDHPAWRCPKRVRCTKCNQLGHYQNTCREKLRMAEEEMECAVCASRDHLENRCSKLWSGFDSNLVKPHKVQTVPVYCYLCGKEGHYGGDCGIAPPQSVQKEKNVEMPTPWTMENALQYIDPASTEVAIVYRGEQPDPVGKAPDGRPDLGKSIVPQQHVQYESDDDDEEEFIQPIVQKKPKVQRGVMHFTGGQSSNTNHNNSSNSSRPPHGLPPKPPTSSYQSGTSKPSLGYQAPEPQRYTTRNRNAGGGGGGRGHGGGGSNRGRGGFSNRN